MRDEAKVEAGVEDSLSFSQADTMKGPRKPQDNTSSVTVLEVPAGWSEL